MKISSKFKVRSIVGENVIIKQGKFGADMTKIISLNETSLFIIILFIEIIDGPIEFNLILAGFD